MARTFDASVQRRYHCLVPDQKPHFFADLQAVLFDLDGTLVETNIDFPSMKRATVELCASAGIPATDLAGLDILAAIEHSAAWLAGEKGGRLRRDAWRLLEDIEMTSVPGAHAMPGAAELVQALRDRELKLGIVTRNCRRATTELTALLPAVFGVTITREDVHRTKPDPLHLRAALTKLCAPSSQTLMVGDHRMDVEAGKKAGTMTAGILFGRPVDYFRQAAPGAVFADLQALRIALLGTHR